MTAIFISLQLPNPNPHPFFISILCTHVCNTVWSRFGYHEMVSNSYWHERVQGIVLFAILFRPIAFWAVLLSCFFLIHYCCMLLSIVWPIARAFDSSLVGGLQRCDHDEEKVQPRASWMSALEHTKSQKYEKVKVRNGNKAFLLAIPSSAPPWPRLCIDTYMTLQCPQKPSRSWVYHSMTPHPNCWYPRSDSLLSSLLPYREFLMDTITLVMCVSGHVWDTLYQR